MNDDTARDSKAKSAPDQNPAKRLPAMRADWWKWAAGGAAALALLGGGYYAWTHARPAAPGMQVAGSSAMSDEQAGAIQRDERGAAATAAKGGGDETQTAAAAEHARSGAAEAVVGVASTGAAHDRDGIVVPGRRPVWAHQPSARRLSALYPERALERGREGEARLRCTVQRRGALDCRRVSETPAHAGFGPAALRVARLYRHGPRLANGRAAYGSSIRLRVIFRIADEDRRRYCG